MPKSARKYQEGAMGYQHGKAPQLSGTDHEGITWDVRFDGVDEENRIVIDRKTGVLMNHKTKMTILRQSAVAAVNGYRVRWEVPDARQAKRARKLVEELGVKNITIEEAKL
jgi:filamentous hemagglutinin